MIGPMATDIYTANAAGMGQIMPRGKIQPISAVENHENVSPKSLHDESVKVSISDEAKNLLELLKGEKLPVEQIPDRTANDYGKQLKRRKASEHPLHRSEEKEIQSKTSEPSRNPRFSKVARAYK